MTAAPRKLGREFILLLLLLLAVLSLLFHGVYLPGETLFSNDGPLGRLMSACHQLPARFTGCWEDLNSVGFDAGPAAPGLSFGLQYLLHPVLFSKFYAIIGLVILGLSAWCFFAQLRLAPPACILGALAATLNTSFFSVACWGVVAHDLTAGMTFLALAAVANPAAPRRWLRTVLAGLAVGMGVVEGADVGAIFSLYVVAFILYQAWWNPGPPAARIANGLGRTAVVAVAAVFLAVSTVSSLVNTNIKGVAVTSSDTESSADRWDWATQWSLPVRESVGFVVPGLYGYRMDATNGGNYWGVIGQDPKVERYFANGRQGTAPNGFYRFSGGGFYAGGLVVILALWALRQSFRKKDARFSLGQRQWLWFWGGVALISFLLALGRFAPFYQFVYALPYFSTIRNPIKFTYLVSFALVVLFAYGVDGVWRKYLQPAVRSSTPSRSNGWAAGWSAAARSEPLVIWGCWLGVGFTAIAWMEYAAQRESLAAYLQTVQFNAVQAEAMAGFSVGQLLWFLVFFSLTAGVLTLIFGGALAGRRARWGVVLIAAVLVADLGRANLPWVHYWDIADQYSSNPVIDHFRDQPFEHRVSILPIRDTQGQNNLNPLFRAVWLQQQFPYYDIQAIDIVDMPRIPEDLTTYLTAMRTAPVTTEVQQYARFWQLTNTRYLLGDAGLTNYLDANAGLPPGSFHIVMRFALVTKPGLLVPQTTADYVAVADDQGPYAIYEFDKALPRAKLFSRWQTVADDRAALTQLSNPSFDPAQTVLVAGGLPADAPSHATNQNDGTVSIVSYAPQHIVLRSDAVAASVLLLNDHFNPHWHVLVDGRSESLLRCNYLMRGVYLPAGQHQVEFSFQSPHPLLYVSLSAMGLAWVCLLMVIISARLGSSGKIIADRNTETNGRGGEI